MTAESDRVKKESIEELFDLALAKAEDDGATLSDLIDAMRKEYKSGGMFISPRIYITYSTLDCLKREAEKRNKSVDSVLSSIVLNWTFEQPLDSVS